MLSPATPDLEASSLLLSATDDAHCTVYCWNLLKTDDAHCTVYCCNLLKTDDAQSTAGTTPTFKNFWFLLVYKLSIPTPSAKGYYYLLKRFNQYYLRCILKHSLLLELLEKKWLLLV